MSVFLKEYAYYLGFNYLEHLLAMDYDIAQLKEIDAISYVQVCILPAAVR